VIHHSAAAQGQKHIFSEGQNIFFENLTIFEIILLMRITVFYLIGYEQYNKDG
jgi:hypothetical protein